MCNCNATSRRKVRIHKDTTRRWIYRVQVKGLFGIWWTRWKGDYLSDAEDAFGRLVNYQPATGYVVKENP